MHLFAAEPDQFQSDDPKSWSCRLTSLTTGKLQELESENMVTVTYPRGETSNHQWTRKKVGLGLTVSGVTLSRGK